MFCSMTCWIVLGAQAAAPGPSGPPAAPAAGGLHARLDEALEAGWKKLGLTPEAPVDDATFLRRAWLGLAGRVPPPIKAREFLDDKDPAKRARLVDALLAGDDFAEHWGRSWTQRLTGRRPVKQPTYDARVLTEYLRGALKENRSYRQIVSELLTGEGASDSSGPANFLLRYAQPTDLAGAVGKQFLGVSLQCAQCHDHPYAKWKKDDFWGVAAFFARVKVLQGDALTAVLEARRGELQVPDPQAKPAADGQVPMKTIKPRLPVEGSQPAVAGKRRQALAAWVTADGNPYFARHAANQAWAQLFGEPLVKSFDLPAPPGLPAEVLQLLADDFRAGGYDLKRLVRGLVLSRAYQAGTGADVAAGSSDSKEGEARWRKVRNGACFLVRPLPVDTLYESVVQATGHRAGPEAPQPAEGQEEEEAEADVAADSLSERPLTVQRTLALLNGDYVHKAAQAGARAAVAVNGRRAAADQVEWLFLTTLSRRPTADETSLMLGLLRAAPNPTQGLEDVLWVLLNSTEFLTIH
jgi:hypothetical protein